MKKLQTVISLTLLLVFSFPLVIEAKAGSSYGGSNGSYRAPSYQGGGYNYRPTPHYQTPYTTPYSPQKYPQTSPSPYSAQSGSSSGSFLPGLFSGAVGAYIYNKVFNTSATSNPVATTQQPYAQRTAVTQQPTEKRSGGFLRVLLFLLVVYLFWRFLRRRKLNRLNQSQFTRDNQSSPQGDTFRGKSLNDFINQIGGQAAGKQPTTANLSQNDLNDFGDILMAIQNAWSNQDLGQLKNLTTPEMFDYFSRTLQDNQRRNIHNTVSDVNIIKIKQQQAWQEAGTTFAQAELTWRAIDYAIDTSVPDDMAGHLIDGNMTEPTVATEVWTFKKDSSGRWLLAGING